MEKKCQSCGNTFTASKENYMCLNISPFPPAKEELTDTFVGQTRADISKMESEDYCKAQWFLNELNEVL